MHPCPNTNALKNQQKIQSMQGAADERAAAHYAAAVRELRADPVRLQQVLFAYLDDDQASRHVHTLTAAVLGSASARELESLVDAAIAYEAEYGKDLRLRSAHQQLQLETDSADERRWEAARELAA